MLVRPKPCVSTARLCCKRRARRHANTTSTLHCPTRYSAGKSELTNRLVGMKITGVSSKAHTTVEPHLGAFTSGAAQVVLYDTPGLVARPVQAGQGARVRSAWHLANTCHMLLFIVDADAQVLGVREGCWGSNAGRGPNCEETNGAAAYRGPGQCARLTTHAPPAQFRQRRRDVLETAAMLARGPPDKPAGGWRAPRLTLVLNKRDKLDAGLAGAVRCLVQPARCA
jgi:50S ribosome-binding GTPase